MKKSKLIVILLLVGGITAAIAGGAVWWFLQNNASATAGKKVVDKNVVHKYVTLEKLVVMLRRTPGESAAHYLAGDLVFKTTSDKEKITKEHLPLLRSVAVRALSSIDMTQAEQMTVDQFAAEIDRALSASYARDQREKPFSEVMVGKLIIE